MRYLSIVLLLFVPSFAVAGEPLTPRRLDPIAAETFDHAVSRSAVVRALVATLEQSNVIVHIVSSMDMPAGIGGTTRFVTTRGGYRYVRITFDSGLSTTTRTAILAHELQHACEIAASQADDVEGLRQMFLREGSSGGGYFETDRAVEIEKMVRLELGADSTRMSGYSKKPRAEVLPRSLDPTPTPGKSVAVQSQGRRGV